VTQRKWWGDCKTGGGGGEIGCPGWSCPKKKKVEASLKRKMNSVLTGITKRGGIRERVLGRKISNRRREKRIKREKKQGRFQRGASDDRAKRGQQQGYKSGFLTAGWGKGTTGKVGWPETILLKFARRGSAKIKRAFGKKK